MTLNCLAMTEQDLKEGNEFFINGFVRIILANDRVQKDLKKGKELFINAYIISY
jgi:hypothetical protein